MLANQQLRLTSRCDRSRVVLQQKTLSSWTSAQRKARLQNQVACNNAAGTVLALVFGFLPWSGCSQGGFYDTGIQGTSGKDCQAMYQPAAAAEARFAATLRTTGGGGSSSSQNDGDRAELGQGANSSSKPSAESVRGEAPEAARSSATGSTGTSEGLQEVPAASKALIREILQADNRQRTKELVDSAWQSLE